MPRTKSKQIAACISVLSLPAGQDLQKTYRATVTCDTRVTIEVPSPQLVVLDVVRRERVLAAAKVDEEDRRPENPSSRAPPPTGGRRLLVAVEEGGECVYRQGISAKVGEPHAQPQHGDASVAHH